MIFDKIKSRCPQDADPDTTAGPKCEITPEMIAAGVDALLGFESDYQNKPEVVTHVLEAAFRAWPE